MLRDLGVLRVARLRGAQKRLEGDERGLECEHRRPCVLEDVEADRARGGGDVRVVYFRDELHLDGLEGVVVRDSDVLCKRRFSGSENHRTNVHKRERALKLKHSKSHSDLRAPV